MDQTVLNVANTICVFFVCFKHKNPINNVSNNKQLIQHQQQRHRLRTDSSISHWRLGGVGAYVRFIDQMFALCYIVKTQENILSAH